MSTFQSTGTLSFPSFIHPHLPLATFFSVKQVEDYIKDHPNVFQIIYRRETSVNGKIHCGPFHVYHSCK